jgi:hypothetical protein
VSKRPERPADHPLRVTSSVRGTGTVLNQDTGAASALLEFMIEQGGRTVKEKSFEIRVRGEIPHDELAEFENLTAVVLPPGTVLRGDVTDQQALQVLLQRLHTLGLELTEVRRIGRGTPVLPLYGWQP